MINQPFKEWWCCLNAREANTIIGTLGLFVTNPLYIDRFLFDSLTIITGLSSSIKMLEHFVDHYSLRYTTMPDGDGGEKEIVVPTDEFWASMLEFSFTDDYVCTKPCIFLTFPL